MYTEWLAMEHYRIHVMEEWPDGERKQAGLAAARASLGSLEQAAPKGPSDFVCDICASRGEHTNVIPYPLLVESAHPVRRAA